VRNTLIILAICATTAVAVAGCGESSGGGSSTAASEEAATSITAQSKKVGLEATGGKAGAANQSLRPVTLGWINDNGVEGFPGDSFVNSMESAVAFINEDLGGIEGHPLKVVKCEITQSSEQGTVCAQQMLNDKEVVAVVGGGISFGDTEILNTIQGKKPLFTSISSGVADATSENVFGFNGGIVAAGSMLTYINEYLKPKKVSIIGLQEPVTSLIIGLWKGTLENLGVESVTSATFGAGTTDLTSTITAAGASSAEALLLAAAATSPCVSLAAGLTQLGVEQPTVTLGDCADAKVEKAAGGDLPKWTYYFPYKNTLAPDPTGQVETYNNAVAAYGQAAMAQENFAPTVFATVMNLANILNGLGAKATPAQIISATKSYTGPAFLGPEKLEFGKQPYPGLGSTGGRLYQYEGDGKWHDATEGKWIEPPPPGV
jgi:branched-chain amino acid transport system substrate-binding protein